MANTPTNDPDAPAPDVIDASTPRGLSPVWAVARLILSVTLAVAGIAWILRLLIDRDPVRGAWAMQCMLAVTAVLAAGWDTLYRYHHWILPMRRLATLTRQALEGQVPMEALGSVRGGIEPMVPVVQSLLRELRQQEVVIAELNFEMQQKVASRTDALERVIGSLRQQATRDVMTGLFNRRFLDTYLPQAVTRAKQLRADLCVLMIDVDNFKILNDTLGHAAGDDLLRAIGQLIRSAIRGEDVAFRSGGDEFILLLPGYNLTAGQALGDRLTALVDALAKTIKVVRPPRLSVGGAHLRGIKGEVTAHGLLAEADKALYSVKEQRHADDPNHAVNSRRRNRPAA